MLNMSFFLASSCLNSLTLIFRALLFTFLQCTCWKRLSGPWEAFLYSRILETIYFSIPMATAIDRTLTPAASLGFQSLVDSDFLGSTLTYVLTLKGLPSWPPILHHSFATVHVAGRPSSAVGWLPGWLLLFAEGKPGP